MSPESPNHALVGPDLAPGVIRLSGRDALGVLHNISTQSLLDLAPGEARLALLCDFRGRLLHRFAAARLADGSVWLAREDGGGASLAAAIDKSVFREDVNVEDRSEEFAVSAGWDATPGRGHVIEADGRPARIEIPGCPSLVLAPAGAGAPDAASWNAERIAHGWAAHGHEITEGFTPFDVNLGAGVHLDKGCFTGQETLMRLVTYGNLRRRLVRVHFDGAPPEAPGLRDDSGAEAGVLTSAVNPGGTWAALAVVKQVAADDARRAAPLEDRTFTLSDGRAARVEVVFPFAQPAGRVLKEG